jgi:hypothetical protein
LGTRRLKGLTFIKGRWGPLGTLNCPLPKKNIDMYWAVCMQFWPVYFLAALVGGIAGTCDVAPAALAVMAAAACYKNVVKNTVW